MAGQARAGAASSRRLPRALLLVVTLVLLAACTEEGPTFIEPSSGLSEDDAGSRADQRWAGRDDTNVHVQRGRAVARTWPDVAGRLLVDFCGCRVPQLRFDCTYVPDSFQDEWARARSGEEGFGEPGPTQRYSFAHPGGRALVLLPSAFDTGILDRDRLRIKAEAPGPGRLTLWVTKPNPDPGLTYEGVAAVLERKLAAVMSTTEPPAEGSCVASSTDALPPMSATTPDDTTDAPGAISP